MNVHCQHSVEWDHTIDNRVSESCNRKSTHGDWNQCHLEQNGMHGAKFQRRRQTLQPIPVGFLRDSIHLLFKLDESKVGPDNHGTRKVNEEKDIHLSLRIEINDPSKKAGRVQILTSLFEDISSCLQNLQRRCGSRIVLSSFGSRTSRICINTRRKVFDKGIVILGFPTVSRRSLAAHTVIASTTGGQFCRVFDAPPFCRLRAIPMLRHATVE
mmetsp:Transcript_15098/g.26141  ORF Transcript_15098/g.26141 Transcript_15098/m.26141 type:complete len:213 (+) Transcript_15098:65-703(+)